MLALRTRYGLPAVPETWQLARLPPLVFCTPTHVKKGIVIGETTRLALLCSDERTFLKEVSWFKVQLMNRGYPRKALDVWTKRVPWTCRYEVLNGTRAAERKVASDVLRIPTTYNPLWENISLKDVFEKVVGKWRWTWEPETQPSRISLSQSRTENVMDLLSSWNKQVIGTAAFDAELAEEEQDSNPRVTGATRLK